MDSVRSLGQRFAESPDALIDEYDSILRQLGRLFVTQSGDPEDFEFAEFWQWFAPSSQHSNQLQDDLSVAVKRFVRAIRIAHAQGGEICDLVSVDLLTELEQVLRFEFTDEAGPKLKQLNDSLSWNLEQLTSQVDAERAGQGSVDSNNEDSPRKDGEPTQVIDSDYAEPLWKSEVGFLLGIHGETVPDWIERGELKVFPGTPPGKRKIRVLNECFPPGLKRQQERQKRLSERKSN